MTTLLLARRHMPQRLRGLFERRGNDGATRAERKALAEDYRRHEAAPMSPARRARLKAIQPAADHRQREHCA